MVRWAVRWGLGLLLWRPVALRQEGIWRWRMRRACSWDRCSGVFLWEVFWCWRAGSLGVCYLVECCRPRVRSVGSEVCIRSRPCEGFRARRASLVASFCEGWMAVSVFLGAYSQGGWRVPGCACCLCEVEGVRSWLMRAVVRWSRL